MGKERSLHTPGLRLFSTLTPGSAAAMVVYVQMAET
jgi:hypothetical protein